MPCIFCDILDGEAPASYVYQDDRCAAFMDNHPINPGHVLVVPRQHAAWLSDLDVESAKHIFQVAQRIDTALRESTIKCEGINLFLADGRPAGQEVMHVHLHVIPRFIGDGHHLRFAPSYFMPIPAKDLDKNAALIRSHMKSI